MVQGLILLVIGLYVWFGIAKNPTEKSATGFVKIWKSIFGLKGYVITLKVLAVFCILASISEFYKYFFAE